MKRKLLIVLTLVLALSITACSNGDNDKPINEGDKTPVENPETPSTDDSESLDEEPVEEDQSNEEAPQADPEEGQVSADWPEGFIENAPKFEGKIEVSKEEGPKKHFLKFNDVSKEDAEKYIQEVKDAGFTQDTYEHMAEKTMKYKGLDSDNNLVRVFWHYSGDTEVTLVKEAN